MATIKKYLWVAHLFAIAVCAYFAAQTVTTYISMFLEQESSQARLKQTPVRQEKQKLLADVAEYDIVVERNIFNSAELEAEPELPAVEQKKAVDLSAVAVKTSLNLKVLGTLVVDEGTDRRSSATIVGGKSRKPVVYFVGAAESFEEGVDLVRIKKDRIEFVNQGRLEYALLEGVEEALTIFAKAGDVHGKEGQKSGVSLERRSEAPPSDEESATGKFIINQAEVDDALANLDRLYTEIRIVPNFKGGKPAGMKILAVKPGSLFSKLGLKRGDVLERINGLELDIKRGMELFSQLREQKNLQIELVRRGKSETLEYEIQ